MTRQEIQNYYAGLRAGLERSAHRDKDGIWRVGEHGRTLEEALRRENQSEAHRLRTLQEYGE